MKVKMLEVFQGTDVKGILIHEGIEVSVFEIGDEVEVSQALGEYLLQHRKAEKIESAYVPKVELPDPLESEVESEPVTKTKRGKK